MSMPKQVLFILPYPLHQAPSQRFRVEAYFELLKQHGIEYATSTFLDEHTWNILYKKGSAFKKALAVCKGFYIRIAQLFNLGKFDYIFIHREAAPIGPPVFEWLY